jgi:RNA recognition motif-containing protein
MSYTIFIDPLPLSFTAADLAALVRPFGRVVSAKVACDSLGQSLRFGYVKMETADNFAFALASNQDLFAIKKSSTGTNSTEVHELSAGN